MADLVKERKKLQDVMMFMGALGQGAEKILQRSASVVGFQSGKAIGMEATKNFTATTDDLEKAVDLLQEALYGIGLDWKFGLWKKSDEPTYFKDEGDKWVSYMWFQDCLVRNTLFTYADKQEGALCHMSHGFFAGALERILGGKKVDLEILHGGENGCYKKLTVFKEKGGS
ncbi:MAG TPA: hypothetical protein PL110_04100 [Candidatus Eremiobacteraeota bacterium]|nr:MAG: hypothetical protein BWY64_03723 [bacterium ADurb.Bin363]HPZ07270.1 hypothetical protein [Candidatus Eremiobacteraeota bacterium]